MFFKKIHFSIYCLGALLILNPLMASGNIADPYRTLKIGSYLVFLPLCIFLLFLKKRELPFRVHMTDGFVAGSLIWSALSLVWSVDRPLAIETYVLWLAGGLLYFAIRYSQPSRIEKRWLIGCFLTVIGLNTIHGWLQYNGVLLFDWAAQGHAATFGNINYASQHQLIGLILALGGGIYATKSQTKLFFSLFFLFAISWFYLLGTRASWVGLAVAMLFFLLVIGLKFGKQKQIKFLPIMIGGGGFLILGGVASVFLLHQRSISLGETIDFRLGHALNTLMMIRDFPVLGVGFGNFGDMYPLYHRNFENLVPIESHIMLRTPHNEYLRIWSETGIVGLLLFLGMVGIPMISKLGTPQENLVEAVVSSPASDQKDYKKNRSDQKVSKKKKLKKINPTLVETPVAKKIVTEIEPRALNVLKAVILAVLVNSIFSFPLTHPQILLPFFLCMGMLSNHIVPLRFEKTPHYIKIPYPVVAYMLLGGVLLGIIGAGVRYTSSRYLVVAARELLVEGNYQEAEKVYLQSIEHSPSYTKPYYDLIRHLSRTDPRKMLRFSSQILQYRPHHWTYLFYQERALRALGKHEEAQAVRAHGKAIMPSLFK